MPVSFEPATPLTARGEPMISNTNGFTLGEDWMSGAGPKHYTGMPAVCFGPVAPILTADGTSRPILDVRVGDSVHQPSA